MTDKIDLAEYLKSNGKEDFETLFDNAKDIYQLRLENTDVPKNTVQKINCVKDFVKKQLNGMDNTIKKSFIKNDVVQHFGIDKTTANDIIREVIPKETNKSKPKFTTGPASYEGLYEVDDMGRTRLIPQAVANYLIDKWNVVSYKEDIYVYKDGYYVPGEEIIKADILIIANECEVKHGIRNISADCVYATTFTYPESEYPFNQIKDHYPVKNGVVKVDYINDTIELLPHSPEYRFNYILNVDFVDQPENDYIHENVISKYVQPEYVDILYQIPAQALIQINSDPFKKAYLIQGDPHAGKSTYLDLIEEVFGNNNISGESLHALGDRPFSKANLEGKLFNIYDDMSDIPMSETGVFKTLTGKRYHSIERKGKQGYMAELTAVHIFTCNTPPSFDTKIKNDTAFWERWEYIHFPYWFAIDEKFTEKTFTDENISAFFYRILKAVITIKREGLQIKSDASEVREMWSFNSDPLYQYMNEVLETVEGKDLCTYVDKEHLKESIVQWANMNNIDMAKIPGSVKGLTQSLDKYGVRATRITNEQGIQVRAYELPGVFSLEAKYVPDVIKTKKEQMKLGD